MRNIFKLNCKKCDKEYEIFITESKLKSGKYRKNCSRKCANSRNHSVETKNKIKIAVLKQERCNKKRYCISCKELETKSINSKYCLSCFKYNSSKKIYKKLNCLKEDLRESNKIAIEKLSYIYLVLNKNFNEIAKEFNINVNSCYKFFKKNNIKIRNLSEANKLSIFLGKNKLIVFGNKKYKSGYHKTWFNSKVFLRSNYELEMAYRLDELKEVYLVENKRFKYFYLDKEKVYTSDFYIPNRNTIIETKCKYFYEKNLEVNRLKENSVKEKGYLFYLLLSLEEIKKFIF